MNHPIVAFSNSPLPGRILFSLFAVCGLLSFLAGPNGPVTDPAIGVNYTFSTCTSPTSLNSGATTATYTFASTDCGGYGFTAICNGSGTTPASPASLGIITVTATTHFYLRFFRNGGVGSITSGVLKSTSGAAFKLTGLTIYPANAGNPQTMTLTAFKAGTMVTGSTITINYVAPAHETALTSTDFGINYDNIDEIRATTSQVQGIELTNIKTAAPSTPLPVHLISFTGQNTASGQVLHWKVENEVSFSHYTVEESIDGANYTDMGTVPATGKSDYTFTSTSVRPHNYYRLKLVDIDGVFSYSNVLVLEGIPARQEVLVYPNPAVSQINISSPARLLSISVSSASGKEIIRQIAPDGLQATLFIGALPPGIYLIGVRTTEGLTIRKISKL